MFNIDWYIDYANNPSISLKRGFGIQDSDIKWDFVDLGMGKMYWGEKDNFFHFYLSTNNKEGYGGRQFILPIEGSSHFKVVGPWSSRASIINNLIDQGKIPGEHVVDCDHHSIRKSAVEKELKSRGFFLYCDNGCYCPSIEKNRVVKLQHFTYINKMGNVVDCIKNSEGNTSLNGYILPVKWEDFRKNLKNWQFGIPIQEAFSKYSPDIREYIMTGITPEQWEKL